MRKFNKKSLKLVCLMLTIVMLFTVLPVWAVGEEYVIERNPLPRVPIAVAELEASILLIEEFSTDMENVTEIRNIAEFQQAVRENYPNMPNYELARTILRALGDTDEQIDTMPRQMVLYALNYTAVVKTDSFFGVTYGGEKIEMTREEFDASVAISKASEDIQSINPFWNPPPSDDRIHGNLILRTRIFRTGATPQFPNRFQIRAEAEWITLPFFRGENMLAIGHTSTANIDNSFNSHAEVRYLSIHGAWWDRADRHSNGRYIRMSPEINGMAVRYFLEAGSGTLGSQVNSPVRLWHNITIPTGNTTNVMVGYGHRGLHFFGSMSVSISGSGPSISFSPGVSTTTFTGWPLAVSWNMGM